MNDADTLGYLLLTSYMAGTTSAPAPNAQLRQVSVELASGGWRPQRGWYGGPRCRWVPGHVVNDADTSEYLPFTSYILGTTCGRPQVCSFVVLDRGI